MLDADEAIDDYTTEIDLSWLQQPYPQEVLRTTLVSGDRDLIADDIPKLKEKYGAVAGDWESGAIAWVAALNKKRCLILRGVTDLVGADGGEAYDGNVQVFIDNAAKILKPLVHHLPNWLSQAY
jgi:adenosylhomocysteine nucleosidase